MGNSISTLLRLDFKARFAKSKKTKASDYVKQFMNIFFTLVIYGIVVVGIVYLTKMFVGKGAAADLQYEYLVLTTMISMLAQMLICTSTLVKNLYFNGDNELLLRFPVSGLQIFCAKSIYVVIHNFVIGLCLVMPFYISYGVITSAGFGFYVAAICVFVLSTFLPFFLANIIAIPVMWIVNFVKNRFLIILIFLIAIIGAGFAGYMTILSAILEYMQDENVNLFSPEVIAAIQNVANYAYPFKWYGDIVAGREKWWLSLIYVFLVTVAFGAGAFFVQRATYYKTILYGIETEKSSFKRKTPSIRRSQFGTILHREFLLIFRSFNYSFQYFAMACAAPVMVYFCNSLASQIGESSVGSRILPGLTLLVIIIFVTIIVSFASTTISREGNTFYQTKTIPVSYTKQILAKLLLYGVVATASVLACCIMIYYVFGTEAHGNSITAKDAINIFAICELVVVGLTCLSIKADLKAPTFNVSGDGELVEANKNVSVSIFIGCVIAVCFGLFAMIFSYMPLQFGYWQVIKNGVEGTYQFLLVVSAIFAVVTVVNLFVGLNKNYSHIVP